MQDVNLGELAIVQELISLINSTLAANEKAIKEVPYQFIENPHDISLRDLRRRDTKKAPLLDILIVEVGPLRNVIPKYCFEVKRIKAGRKLIEDDIDRISSLKRSVDNLSTYVLIIGHNKLPSNFRSYWFKTGTRIIANGQAKPLATKTGAKYIVRRVFKASHTNVSSSSPSNYLIVLEII